MKESEELLNLLSITSNQQELIDLSAKIEEFETYMRDNGVETKRRQLIISQEERFLSLYRSDSFWQK